ncbi:serine/threonine-protein kinase [Nonomuraea rhodomycinica]|uniref:serine/threonine-protein kinase n=1 Tax=Nonomuraea rhodomycinica TaxID=1712872 RepID=UPI001C377628|nr:serine/threonine-protein kinase [Nonomuraea rhodomycinica]
MPSISRLNPGDPATLGGYEIKGRLGEGGQGVVYLGEDREGGRVAVKWLRPHLAGDAVAAERFAREAAAARRVAPFCTAKVLATGVHDERPYIVSEYVDGPSLQEAVARDGPRTDAALHRLAIGTVTALAAIHQAGIVHRDLSPGNVLLGADGPRVIDFGIARALDATSTITSMPVGTPAFMAPEQILAQAVGPAADMFAWGSTILFAASGAGPFAASSVPTIIQRVLYTEPDLTPLAEPLRELVAACLAKDPARRPTAEQVIMRLLQSPSSAEAPELEQAAAVVNAGPPVPPLPGPPESSRPPGPQVSSASGPQAAPHPGPQGSSRPGPEVPSHSGAQASSQVGPQVAGGSGPQPPQGPPHGGTADQAGTPSAGPGAAPQGPHGPPPSYGPPPSSGPGAPQGSPQGAGPGGPQGSPQGAGPGGPQGSPQGAGPGAPQSPPHGAGPGGPQRFPQSSGPGGPQGSPYDAAPGRPQNWPPYAPPGGPQGPPPGAPLAGSAPLPPYGGPGSRAPRPQGPRRGMVVAGVAAAVAVVATIAVVAVAVVRMRDDPGPAPTLAATATATATPSLAPVPTTGLGRLTLPGTTATLFESPADKVRLTTYMLRDPKTQNWVYYARDSLTGNFVKYPEAWEALLSPDGRYLASRGKQFVGGYDTVDITDKATGEKFSIRTSRQPLSAYVQTWSRDGNRLLLNVGSAAGTEWQSTGFAIVDVATRQASVATLREGALRGIRYGFDERDTGVVALSSVAKQQALRFFDAGGTRVRRVPNVGAAIADSLFSPTGQKFVTNCPGLVSGDNCVYDTATGAELTRFESPCSGLATWYDDLHLVCWTNPDGGRYEIHVIDFTGTPVRTLLTVPTGGENMDVVFSHPRR